MPPPTAREGSSVVRAPQDDVLFVADEDHGALRIVPLPVEDDTKVTTVSLPGRPAQVIASRDRVLVTVRDLPEGGGGLVVLQREGSLGLKEIARVTLPADAWGMALAPDESFVVISSAWPSRVSIVDLATAKVRATVDVGREPRGVAILPDGKRAYVSHLVGSAITRIDALDGATPSVARLEFPSAPLRAGAGAKLPASLGYAVVPSPQGDRLFFPRHALGARGGGAWFGTAAVDVWLSGTDAALVPPRPPGPPRSTEIELIKEMGGTAELMTGANVFVQPRAAIYRPMARTLLVASEGTDELVELDALMSDPTLGKLRSYAMARHENKFYDVATRGGAPSGIALSRDEEFAYVHCRSTDDLVAVRLVRGEGQYIAVPPTIVHLTGNEASAKDESFTLGRALFYNATDAITSGGLACAGCHPDGRDDGHVWHETKFSDGEGKEITNFMASVDSVALLDQHVDVPGGYGCAGSTSFEPATIDGDAKAPRGVGYPRQTPMIAGRVAAFGPYGWHAESPDLAARLVAGFGLHRWREGSGAPENLRARATHLAKFVREGLVPPPRSNRPLTEQEQKGKTIFESATAQCSRCHVPSSGFTDRAAVPLPEGPTPPGFAKEENLAFKTPSLLHVGGTAPYFHDGRYDSLQALVEKNADRMGKTSHLSADDKKALVAYLETL
jgi:YVTN family beta-propeller protein